MKKILFLLLLLYASIACPAATASVPHIRLQDVWAYGEIVTDSTILPFEKNNLRFYCEPIENVPADSVVYDFMLEGYDKSWYTPFGEGWYFYTELPAGDYVFHARCRYLNSEWGPEITHAFSIASPWWRTWWAYSIYVALASCIGFYIVYLIRERIKLSNRLRVERELKRFRSEFVIQASREFRTPLTIIRTVIEKLTGTQEDHLTRTDIQHLRNSSNLLMQMVEDLMEYRNISSEVSPASINDVIELADIPINNHQVLIVEQDAEVADVIRRDLLKYVKVQTYGSSSGIVEKVMEMRPHVVIVDTEMGNVNAYDIVHEIHKRTQAIIILISDFDNKRSLIRAIRSEADDFLQKPFNCEVLSAMVIKRIKIREQYRADSMAEDGKGGKEKVEEGENVGALIEKRSDMLFIERLDSYVAANLSNPDYDVNALADSMKISRGQLGRKLKELRGVSPVVYMRDCRLERAAWLIRNSDMTVKEVMQNVGMTDPNNFHRRFKDRYGKSPLCYKNAPDT